MKSNEYIKKMKSGALCALSALEIAIYWSTALSNSLKPPHLNETDILQSM